MIIWNHPIDLHYYTKSLQGWPKFVCEVWNLDSYGQRQLSGYGFCQIPTQAGVHDLKVSVWRPMGSSREEVFEYFLGNPPHLTNKKLLHDTSQANDDRFRITSKSAGTVHVRLNVMMRNIDAHKIKSD
jgi:B9 domain-containing protein 2